MGQRNRFSVCHLIVSGMLLILLITGCQPPAKRPAPKETPEEEPNISLYLHETGETKQIKMEEYLAGVVAAEMDPNWPEEALAAQAILARTFTMKKIADGGVKSRGTDASTDIEEFQAYDPEKINDKVKKAVNRTRGEVVTHKGKYINGWFHADSGGQTAASSEEGLDYDKEETPYIVSVEDPGHKITTPENKDWQATFSSEEVRQAMVATTGKDPGSIQRIAIGEKGASGRVRTIQINDLTVSGPALRLALGSEKMRSTLLKDLQMNQGQILISGQGFGHGVGMSQWGAKALAQEGKKAEEIIEFFFRDIQIETKWK